MSTRAEGNIATNGVTDFARHYYITHTHTMLSGDFEKKNYEEAKKQTNNWKKFEKSIPRNNT